MRDRDARLGPTLQFRQPPRGANDSDSRVQHPHHRYRLWRRAIRCGVSGGPSAAGRLDRLRYLAVGPADAGRGAGGRLGASAGGVVDPDPCASGSCWRCRSLVAAFAQCAGAGASARCAAPDRPCAADCRRHRGVWRGGHGAPLRRYRAGAGRARGRGRRGSYRDAGQARAAHRRDAWTCAPSSVRVGCAQPQLVHRRHLRPCRIASWTVRVALSSCRRPRRCNSNPRPCCSRSRA